MKSPERLAMPGLQPMRLGSALAYLRRAVSDEVLAATLHRAHCLALLRHRESIDRPVQPMDADVIAVDLSRENLKMLKCVVQLQMGVELGQAVPARPPVVLLLNEPVDPRHPSISAFPDG